MKCIENQKETTFEESIGNVKFILELMVMVIDNNITFQQLVAPYWSKIDA